MFFQLSFFVLVGCGGGGSPHSVCDDYVVCASAVSVELGNDVSALYGDDGACWESADDPDTCASQCEEGILGLWYRTAEPDCDPSELGIEGELTQAAFEAAYLDRFCEEWSACNTAGTECPTGPGGSSTYYGGTTTNPCDYDAVAAQECLGGTWTCNTDFPGFEFPVPPDACAGVCDGYAR